ncbi:transposase [Streptomyces sp. NPDC004393]
MTRGCAAATGVGTRKPSEIEDGLWERIEPLLPIVQRRSLSPRRRRLDQRKVLRKILFVPCTGIRWGRRTTFPGAGVVYSIWRYCGYGQCGGALNGYERKSQTKAVKVASVRAGASAVGSCGCCDGRGEEVAAAGSGRNGSPDGCGAGRQPQ